MAMLSKKKDPLVDEPEKKDEVDATAEERAEAERQSEKPTS